MLTAEYRYEKDIQVKQWEAKKDGWAEGRILLGKTFRFVRETRMFWIPKPQRNWDAAARGERCTETI